MILTLAKKELLVLMQDLHGIAVLFLMPAMFVVIMALAIPSQAELVQKRLLISVSAMTDNDAYQLLLAFIQNDSQLQLSENSGEADAKLKIFSNFDTQDLDKLELAISSDTSHVQRLQIQQSIQTALAKVRLHGVLIDLEMMSGEDAFEERISAVESQTQLVPLSVTGQHSSQAFPSPVQQSVPSWLIFGMYFIVLPFSQTLLKEKHNSTVMRLRSFGMLPHEMILSKLLPYFVINQLQFWFLIAVGRFLVPLMGGEAFHFQGPVLNYVCLSVMISFTALGLSSLIAVIVKTQEQAVVLGGGLNLILAALGGVMVPKYVMSEKINAVTGLSPMGWSLDAFQQLLLQDKTLSDIGGLLLMMLLFSIIMLSTASVIYSHKFWKLGWNSAN